MLQYIMLSTRNNHTNKWTRKKNTYKSFIPKNKNCPKQSFWPFFCTEQICSLETTFTQKTYSKWIHILHNFDHGWSIIMLIFAPLSPLDNISRPETVFNHEKIFTNSLKTKNNNNINNKKPIPNIQQIHNDDIKKVCEEWKHGITYCIIVYELWKKATPTTTSITTTSRNNNNTVIALN